MYVLHLSLKSDIIYELALRSDEFWRPSHTRSRVNGFVFVVVLMLTTISIMKSNELLLVAGFGSRSVKDGKRQKSKCFFLLIQYSGTIRILLRILSFYLNEKRRKISMENGICE